MSKINDAALKLKTILDILDHRKTHGDHKEIMNRKTSDGTALTKNMQENMVNSLQAGQDYGNITYTYTNDKQLKNTFEQMEDIINQDGSINFNSFSEDDLNQVLKKFGERRDILEKNEYEIARTSLKNYSLIYFKNKKKLSDMFNKNQIDLAIGKTERESKIPRFISKYLNVKTKKKVKRHGNSSKYYDIYKLDIGKIKVEVNAAIEAAIEAARKEKEEADAKAAAEKAAAEKAAAEKAAAEKAAAEKVRLAAEAKKKEMKEAILNKLALTQLEIGKFENIIDKFEEIPSEQKTEAYQIIKPLVEDFNKYHTGVIAVQTKYNETQPEKDIYIAATEMVNDEGTILNSDSPREIRDKFNELLINDKEFMKYFEMSKQNNKWVTNKIPVGIENNLPKLRKNLPIIESKLNEKIAEEKRKKAEEEARKAAAKAEEEARLAEAERKKEEAKRLAAEEKRKQEEKLAAEKAKKEAEEKARKEEERKKQEELKRIKDERLAKEAAEKQRIADEEAVKKEEARREAEEARKAVEEAARKAVEEAKRTAENLKELLNKEEMPIIDAMNYFDKAVTRENIADEFISIEEKEGVQEAEGGKKQAKKPKRKTNKTKRVKKSNKKKRKPKRKTLRKIKKIIFR